METNFYLLIISYLWFWGRGVSLGYGYNGSDSHLVKDVMIPIPFGPWLGNYRVHSAFTYSKRSTGVQHSLKFSPEQMGCGQLSSVSRVQSSCKAFCHLSSELGLVPHYLSPLRMLH